MKTENSAHGFTEGSEASGSVVAPKPDNELIADNPKTYTHFDMLAAVARQTKHMFEENESLRESIKELLPLVAKSPSMSTGEFLKIVDRAKALLGI